MRKAVVDMYDLEGGNWKQSVVKIDAGNAADYTTHNKGGNDSGRSFSQLLSFR
ncbi:MAG: hypothetical protein ACLU37_01225 [Collinsella sp.]